MSIGLKPSKLGTKEHWDNVYKEELTNFEELGDEGEIWFGEESVEKMVEWTCKNAPNSTNPSIIEIGSGNGTLLFGLCEARYSATHLLGIDYSPDAVKLAKSIATTKDKDVAFYACDILTETPPTLPHMPQNTLLGVWDVILDKGTFDAMALANKDDSGNPPASAYPGRVSTLLKRGGYFLITSCNFTEVELKTIFATNDTNLIYHSRVQHQTYTFGGKTGSAYATVAFQKA